MNALICGGALYLLFCLGLYLGQRKLIYRPSSNAALDPQRYGLPPERVHHFTIQTPDGLKLGGWYVAPGNLNRELESSLRDAPWIHLYFHGNGGHRGHRSTLLQCINAFGGHALAIDYRGYGDSEGAPSEAGLALDAASVWLWLTGAMGYPSSRIVLHGESLGCAVAVELAVKCEMRGQPPAGVILEAPFTNLAETAAQLYPFVPVRLLLKEHYPTDERIQSLKTPLLILHGTQDRVIPFAQGKRVFELASMNVKRFIEIPEGEHCNFCLTHPQLYDQSVQSFLNHIGLLQTEVTGITQR